MEAQWMETLGWTLVHFSWQALGIAALFGIFSGIVTVSGAGDARHRYIAGCLALLLFLVAPIATYFYLQNPATVVIYTSPLSWDTPAPSAGSGAPIPQADSPTSISWPSWLTLIWIAGVAFCSLRLSLGAWHWRRMTSHGRALCSVERERLAALARRMGEHSPIRAQLSEHVQSPVVVGFFRYTMVLPITFFGSLSPADADAILAHELAHIRRRDGLVNLLQGIVETLFFFHPAVWWISHEVRKDREKCCDRIASDAVGDPRVYARALLALEEIRLPAAAAALPARRGSLEDRVRYLLAANRRPARAAAVGFAASILGLLLLAGSVWASGLALQDAPPPPPPAPRAPAAPDPIAPAPPPAAPASESAEVPAAAAAEAAAPLPASAPAPPLPEVPVPGVREPSPVPAPARAPVAPVAPRATVAPAPRIAAQAAPAPAGREERLSQLRLEQRTPYRRWVDEDVAYIIEPPEKAAFLRLGSDVERERFVEQFWQRRDPTPDSGRNEVKEEHYRRIAYANERFREGEVAGWRTERGRTYIRFGPPDTIEAHPPEYQRWFYREIAGIGKNISIEFGESRLN